MHPTQPPPSYESLFGELKAAKQESSGTVDFMQKFFAILFASGDNTKNIFVDLNYKEYWDTLKEGHNSNLED